jgi:hypothetical protein
MEFFKANLSACPVGTVIGIIDGIPIIKSKAQKKRNNYLHEYETGKVYVELTKGYYALVSYTEWIEWMQFLKWYAMESKTMSGNVYMATSVKLANGKFKILLAHKLILNVPDGRTGVVVDHSDQNGLNNLPYNISIVSRAANSHNRTKANRNNKSTGEINISIMVTGKYRVAINHKGHPYIWDGFKSLEEARIFRDKVIPKLKVGFSK